jgi:hypothetical protein
MARTRPIPTARPSTHTGSKPAPPVPLIVRREISSTWGWKNAGRARGKEYEREVGVGRRRGNTKLAREEGVDGVMASKEPSPSRPTEKIGTEAKLF